MQKACRLFLLLLVMIVPAWGQESAYLKLHGHLGKEQLQESVELVRTLDETPPKQLVIRVDSYTGDLRAALEVAKDIYALKADKGVKTVVYVHDNAVGPAAVFPFLADELYTSRVVTWGDMRAGSETNLPLNVLRSRLRGLLPPEYPKLQLLAEAMIDPDVIVIDDKGWKVVKVAERGDQVISPIGEALVVNEGQLKELGLLAGVMTPQAFQEKFLPAEEVDERLAPSELAVDELLAKQIYYHEDSENVIGRIEIGRKGIDQSTWIYVKSAIDEFIDTRPSFVILELNTPGGEVFSSQQISDALMDLDTNHNIPVVAFIDNWAISAGAMLAYSCRFIATAKDGAMGAAQPILAGGGAVEAAPEKIRSALRADFANRASFFGRNGLIAQAMVDDDLVLVLRHGKVVELESDQEIRRGGLDPDRVITTKGKLLTLTAEKMIEFGVADFMVRPAAVDPITEAEREAGRWPAAKSLLFQYPFFEAIPNAVIVTHQTDWKTSFFAFLAMPVVSSGLFLLMMLGFYIEFNTPGFGIPGILGLVALFFIVLASFSVDAASWLEVLILLLGMVLLAVEIFVLPGFGIAGILGIIFTIVGLVAMLLPGLGAVDFSWEEGTLNAAGEAVLERLVWLCGAIIVGAIVMVLLSKFVLPKVQRYSKLVLRGEQDREQGYVAGLDIKALPDVGAEGTARSVLRPAGKVMIEDSLFDAVSSGGYIESGKQVKIVRYDGSRMVVEEV